MRCSRRSSSSQQQQQQQQQQHSLHGAAGNGGSNNGNSAHQQQQPLAIPHRPLLHNLLSGGAIHNPHHRNYTTATTGEYTAIKLLFIHFPLVFIALKQLDLKGDSIKVSELHLLYL